MAPVIADSTRVQEPGAEFQPYEALRDDSIRLVEVLPANNDNESVVCRLISVLRHNAPRYHALSYCWGRPEDRGQATILLDVEDIKTQATAQKISLPVTLTLEAALRQLRYNDGQTSQMLWVDAICINQTDEKEKGIQVQSMRHIYQNAAEVSVWLGNNDEQSLLAWDLIYELDGCNGNILTLQQLAERSREKQFVALQNLFRRDYFWRIWVVQEITCAKNAVVYCGSKMMSWPRFQNIGNYIGQIRETLMNSIYHGRPAALYGLISGGPKNLKIASTRDEELHEITQLPLLDLLKLHMSKLSTDPRDKVYGLMGIASDGQLYGATDYTRSPRATFIHVARCIILSTKKLSFICLCQNDDNTYLLPSWVPDWERRNLYPRHRVVGLHIRMPPFKAARDSNASPIFLEDGEVLLTRGFVVDTITTVACPMYLEGPESEVTPVLKTFYNWFTIFMNAWGMRELDIFARTFCGGSWYPQYSEFEKDLSQRTSFFFGLIEKLLPELLVDGNPVQHIENVSGINQQVREAREYAMVSSAALRMHAKRFVLTRTRLCGLAPCNTMNGDKIAVLFGCDFPVVLRKVGSHWNLIGEVYVDGIMYGELMGDPRRTECTFAIR